MKIFQNLSELLFPHRCISCAVLGSSLCSQCRLGWNLHHYTTQLEGLTVTSSILYSNVASKVLLAAKESHIQRADLLVSQAITQSLKNFLAASQCDFLVPIPSRASAVRKRGRQFVTEVALNSSQECGVPLIEMITHSRKVRDQSGLHLLDRRNNLAGAFVIPLQLQRRGKAVLVDDLVTTGSTLLEAARALRYAGIEVIGAVTAAVAQPLR